MEEPTFSFPTGRMAWFLLESNRKFRAIFRRQVQMSCQEAIHPVIVEALEKWKEHQRYRKPRDWVFASGCRRDRHPYWGQTILRKLIRT
jgi:hypothetical protein